MTPPGIDTRTVRLVAEHFNHYATPGPTLLQVYTISMLNHLFPNENIIPWERFLKYHILILLDMKRNVITVRQLLCICLYCLFNLKIGRMSRRLTQLQNKTLLNQNFCNVICNFIFEFPCIISLYYIRKQQDATLAVLFISNCKSTLHVSDVHRVHHQEYINCSSSHWCMSCVRILYIQ